MRAAVKSGRSDFESSAPKKLDRPLSAVASMVLIAALPPAAGAGSKAVVRTVMNLILSLDFTVAMALPA